ncbi:MAG: zinc-dependent metalloprotease [Chitinophagaceae bacterium]
MKAIVKFLLVFAGALTIHLNIKSQTVKLSSLPSAPATIYLDFDGEYVTGTSWNWNGPINAKPAGLTNEAISEIFKRVAEDYRPFNLNITTDPVVYLSAPFDRRIRIIITPTSSWYGKAGGVSFVGSFKWGDETPAWIFGTLLNNNVKYIAEACSHEMGHTLGLQHQSTYNGECKKISEYNTGRGEGEIGWAPIMGNSYYKNHTTWHTGSSTMGCNNIQNDLEILAGSGNGFGFRPDDHHNDRSTATPIKTTGHNFLVTGLINRPQDADQFKITLNTLTNLRLNAIPENVGIGNQGADIDIKVALLNSNADTIGIYNPVNLLGVGIDTTLNHGTYYLSVAATANINHSVYGSLGLYSLSGSLGTNLPLHQIILKAEKVTGDYVLKWNYLTDEPIMNIIVEKSVDGKTFSPLILLDANARNYRCRPTTTTAYYRMKAVALADERSYYSNICNINSGKETKKVQVLANRMSGQVTMLADATYTFQVFDISGKLILQGKLVNGRNNVNLDNSPKGILLMRVSNGVKSWTEKILNQ